jgi:hypothetical protein
MSTVALRPLPDRCCAEHRKGLPMNRRSFLQTGGAGTTGLALAASTQLGAQPQGNSDDQSAFEFLGRSNQEGPNVTHFGYLTHIFGLADELLFATSSVRTEATARFTFYARTTLDSRHELGNLITTSAPGELTLFLSENPQGDFNNPDSFARGNAVASYSTRYHNVLNVQSPNQGITNAVVDLVQLGSSSFSVNGHRFQWGRPGLQARMSATGQGTRTQPDPLRAFFLVAGQVVIVDP